MAEEPGDAGGVPEAETGWLADAVDGTDSTEPSAPLLATDGGEPEDGPADSNLDERLAAVEAAVADLDADLDEKIQDVRDRVVQLKIESEEKAEREHDHPEVVSRLDGAGERLDALEGDLGPAVDRVGERLAAVDERVDRGFENFEEVLEYLVETTDDLHDEVATLARATVGARERTERLAAAEARRAAAEDLRRAGASRGVGAATCENCGQAVQLALLASPDCPHCGSRFTELEPRRGFFRSSVLHTGERPALEGEVAGPSPELASIAERRGADAPTFDATPNDAEPVDGQGEPSPGAVASGDGPAGPTDAAGDDGEAVAATTDDGGERSLTSLPAVEPADAEALAGAGVETVGALALADLDRLVRDTDIERDRVEELVGQARESVETG